MDSNKVTIKDILSAKNKRKITMLTAYDYPLASVIDKAGIDIILVGDSLANVVLGLASTKDVGMTEMIHHSKAAARAVKHALLVGDMPYESYQVENSVCVENAQRFIKEAHCDAIKIEWFDKCLEVTDKIIKAGIAVMAHIGLTPQTADKIGGFKVQGKTKENAKLLIEQAKSLEKLGCFSIVLECIPDRIAEIITKEINIPTIGIGAGVNCDGQVLVSHDMLGLFDRYTPKFVKKYINLNEEILKAVSRYKIEVLEGKFPTKEHTFTIKEEEISKLKGCCNNH